MINQNRRLFIFIVMVLCSQYMLSQSIVNLNTVEYEYLLKVKEQENFEGVCVYNNTSTKIMTIISFSDNGTKSQWLYIDKYKDRLYHVETYSENILHGYYYTVDSCGFYINGKKDGRWEYNNNLGYSSSYETYKNGVLNGSFCNKKYNQIFEEIEETEGEYKNGKLKNKEYKYTKQTGKIEKEEGFIRGNSKNGHWKYFQGKDQKGHLILREEGNYLEGMKTGTWFRYQPSGEHLESKQEYSLGMRNGSFEYWSLMDLRIQGQFTNDEKEGEWIYYDYDFEKEGNRITKKESYK